MNALSSAVTVHEYLFVVALLFVLGLAIVIYRRNTILMLIGIELMLNSANINFVVFSRVHENLAGQVFAVFVIVAAAAEAAVAIAIIVLLYHHFKSVDIGSARHLQR